MDIPETTKNSKTASTKKTEIAKALIAVQTELKNPEKNKKGYGYNYAELSSILDQIKPVLQKHKLAVVQLAKAKNGSVGVKTILIHESGESYSSNLLLPVPEMKGANAPQSAGAAITYARRYALSAILNIAADEDTDAVNPVEKARQTRATRPSASTETHKMCPIHNVPLFLMKKGSQSWYAHKLPDGKWCNGK